MVRPLCFGTFGSVRVIREAIIGIVRAGGPDLLAVDDPVVAVASRRGCAGPRRRSRRPARRTAGTRSPRRRRASAGRARLCSSLANAITVGPHMPWPILNGCAQLDVDAFLLLPDHALDRRRAAAAIFLRPVQAGPAAVGLLLLPGLCRLDQVWRRCSLARAWIATALGQAPSARSDRSRPGRLRGIRLPAGKRVLADSGACAPRCRTPSPSGRTCPRRSGTAASACRRRPLPAARSPSRSGSRRGRHIPSASAGRPSRLRPSSSARPCRHRRSLPSPAGCGRARIWKAPPHIASARWRRSICGR